MAATTTIIETKCIKRILVCLIKYMNTSGLGFNSQKKNTVTQTKYAYVSGSLIRQCRQEMVLHKCNNDSKQFTGIQSVQSNCWFAAMG